MFIQSVIDSIYRLILVCSMLFCSSLEVYSQLHLEVTRLPATTPTQTPLYLATSFDNWNPANPRFMLKETPTHTYAIDLPDTLAQFEYKFTRGSWKEVEGDFAGKTRPNRIYAAPKDGKFVKITIESWEDLFFYTFVLTHVPDNTPSDAAIYIAGNFNDWNPNYAPHRLKKMPNGTWQITLFSNLEEIQYKFTRGSWESVEGRANGKALPNRRIWRNTSNRILKAEIASWEDLSYKISIYDLLLFFSAFQGILLIVAIVTIQDNNQEANRLLILLIGVTSVALLSRVFPGYRAVFQAYPRLILLPELILFLYAPLFYLYIQKLLTVHNPQGRKWYHFVPFMLLLLVYMPYFLMDKQRFIDKIVGRELAGIFSAVGGIALVTNTYYWFVCRQVIRKYKQQYSRSHSLEQNLSYLNAALFIEGLCLLVWVFTCLAVVVGKVLEVDTLWLVERSTDAIWLVFSALPYFMGYVAIHQPEVFRLSQQVEFFNPKDVIKTEVSTKVLEDVRVVSIEVDTGESEPDFNLLILREKVDAYLRDHKPYINPRLTLHELADALELHPNVLSKTINDGFERNFFDLVNSYRIEEFKRLLEIPQYENYTLLGIAFEVGFNSKTAFNRSFKKLTQLTPSEYFYQVKGKSAAV